MISDKKWTQPPDKSWNVDLDPKTKWNQDQTQSDLYNQLRLKLNQMDYQQDFTIDSLPLIQQLLADLVQTTKTAKEYKIQLDQSNQEVKILSDQIVPLRNEIKRLTNENNHLHKDIILMADSRDAKQDQYMKTTKSLENTIQQLKFLNSQYLNQNQIESQKNYQTNQKFEDLLMKFKVNQNNTDNVKVGKLFQRLQKIDIETGLAPLANTQPHFNPPDLVMADVVKISQLQNDELTQQNKEKDSKILYLENEVQLMRDQIAKRDTELTRIGNQLEIARSQQFGAPQHLTLPGNESPTKSNLRTLGIQDMDTAKDRIEQLEIQIEYLQDHIDGLEKEVVSLEDSKGVVQSTFVEEKLQLVKDLANERNKTKNLMANLEKLEKMVNDLSETRPKPVPQNESKLPVTIIASQKSSNVKQAKVIADLTEQLKTATQKQEQSTKRINTLQKDIQRLNTENKKLNITIERYDNTLKEAESKKAICNDPKHKSFDQHSTELEKKLANAHKTTDQVTPLENSIKRLSEQNNQLNSTIQTLSLKIESSDQLLQDVKIEKSKITRELGVVERERDELIGALDSFEGELSAVCDRVVEVTKERDNLSALYKQINEQYQKLRNQSGIGRTNSPEKNYIPSTKELDLQNTINNLNAEIDHLKEDIHAMVVQQQQTGTVANEAVLQLEHELNEYKRSLQSLELEKLEFQKKLEESLAESNHYKSLYQEQVKQTEQDSKKIIQYDLDKDHENLKLRELKSKLSELEHLLTKKESELVSLKSACEEKERLLGEHRHLLSQVDRERDTYQNELDFKSEKILELEEKLSIVQKSNTQMEAESHEIKSEIETLTQHLNHQDREVLSLQHQLQDLSATCKSFETQSVQFQQENERISSDLMALTRENQILSSELGTVVQDRDQFIYQIQECDKQIESLNELVNGKDLEKQQLMNNYRNVILDHDRLDLALQSCQEEGNNLKMELVMRDKRIHQLQQQLDALSQDLNKLQIDNTAYEKQSSNLARSLSTAERTMKQLETDKQRLMREIGTARDVTHSLDRNKDDLHKKYLAINIENDRLQNQIEQNLVEIQSLKTQVQSEYMKTDRLEKLLASERTKMIQNEKSNTDLKSSQTQLEIHLQELNSQQSQTLISLNKQLNEHREEIKNLKIRITNLQESMMRKEEELELNKRQLENERQEVMKLKKMMESKETTIKDLIDMKTKEQEFGPTTFDGKIIEELNKTQKQIQSFDDQIQAHQSIDPIPVNPLLNPSSILMDQKVLETVVQATRDQSL